MNTLSSSRNSAQRTTLLLLSFATYSLTSVLPVTDSALAQMPSASLQVSNNLKVQVELSPAERQVLEEFGSVVELGHELQELNQIPSGERSLQQQQRLTELRDAQRELLQRYQEFINTPEIRAAIEQGRNNGAASNLEDISSLQDTLRNLEQPTVLLYPLVLKDRLELILLTSYAPPIHYRVTVSQAELNQAIAAFRQALQDPMSDAIAPAQRLYQYLIQPIENELSQSNATTILYAPDGTLRYIPLAALHDGNRWLTERFVINNITSASLMNSTRAPRASEPKILAAAFTEGSYRIDVGGNQMTFNALAGAQQEVDAIATLFPNTAVLSGSEFTPAALLSQANDYNIIHLATNAMFTPGSPEDSFIFFGNGDRVTLSEMRNWNLSNVDLVVLSACEIGIGESLGNGVEILGFAYILQQAGAQVAIASLWQVSDGGSQALMEAFYQALRSDTSSYAAALRQAQLTLIHQEALPSTRQLKAAIQVIKASEPTLDHPYYWAPFILIGDGL
jgi:CHAT domain-containing protein